MHSAAVAAAFVWGDVLAPEPVSAPDEVHLVDGHPLGLRQEERDEGGHDDHPGREEVEESELEVAEHGEERLADDEGEQHVDAHGDALPGRPDLQREHLAGHEPAQGTPGPGEAGDVEADEDDEEQGVGPGHLADARGAELERDQRAHHHLGHEHLRAALEEQGAAAEAVDGDDGDDGGEHVDETRDDGGHEGRVPAEADGEEQHGRVEHDDVDPSELLEAGDEHGDGELGPVLGLQDVPPRVRDGLGLLAGGDHVVVLVVHVGGAPDLDQHLLGLGGVSPGDEGVGGVGKGERADCDDEGRDAGKAEADAPAPAALDADGGVVDEVGGEDADGGHELEPNVEHAAEVGGGHLGEVERDGLVGEADPDAEEDAAEDEHYQVRGGTVEGGAGEEGDAAAEHGPLAAKDARDGGGHEGRRERRQVERRREERQQLAVELAVLVRVLVRLRLGEHRREELAQERVHGRHAACTQISLELAL